MPPKRELKRLELLESDTDSDYSPKTIALKRRKQNRGLSDSPSASDTDSGRKKRRKNLPEPDTADESNDDVKEEPVTYSDIICQTHKLMNVDIDIPDEYLSGITYKQFNKFVRPIVTEANPKVSGLHVTSLVGAKWREFKELYGMDTMSDVRELDRAKNIAVPSPSASESDIKDGLPASPDSLIINDSGEGSEEDDYYDDESTLKLKMIRRGNKIFRAGDRKTSRQSKKTARQGIVNLDEINLDEMGKSEVVDDNSEEVVKKKPGPKKRTGPRIKNTKDKKEKKKAAAMAAAAGRSVKRGNTFGGKRATRVKTLQQVKVTIQNGLDTEMDTKKNPRVVFMSKAKVIGSTTGPLTLDTHDRIDSVVTGVTSVNIQPDLAQQELRNAQLRTENLQLEKNLLMRQQETFNLNKQYMELKVENQILKNNEIKEKMYGSQRKSTKTVDFALLDVPSKTVESNVFAVFPNVDPKTTVDANVEF